MVCERGLFISKMYPRFLALDKFLRDLRPKQIRWTDKQTLKCWMATILTTVSQGKQNLSNEK